MCNTLTKSLFREDPEDKIGAKLQINSQGIIVIPISCREGKPKRGRVVSVKFKRDPAFYSTLYASIERKLAILFPVKETSKQVSIPAKHFWVVWLE